MKSRDVTAAYSGGWAGSLVSISPASALSLPDAALGPAAFASRAWLIAIRGSGSVEEKS